MTTWRQKEGEWLRTAGCFAALMCLIALFPLPMQSFYTVFRFVVTVAALWYASAAYRQSNVFPMLIFAAVAAFFNPIFLLDVPPIYWKPVSFVAALLFLAAVARTPKTLVSATAERVP